MSYRLNNAMLAVVAVVAVLVHGSALRAQPHEEPYCLLPEQRQIEHRCPHEFCRLPIPGVPQPPTVRDPQDNREAIYISLDEAIRIALENTEVIRVLNGTSASATGRTVYDPAITNTAVDSARARFDPQIDLRNTWGRSETPFFDATPGVIIGTDTESYNLGLGISQVKPGGGLASLGVNATPARVGPLGTETPSSVDFQFDQPWLQGAGRQVNLAPIVISRINSEISYFQFKDSIQEMVRSIIDGYWGLIFARTELWARKQQIEQAEFALEYFEAQKEVGRANVSDIAQARVSLARFRASLVTTRANLLNREAAFRNALGLPPVDGRHLIASTPPVREQADPDWDDLLMTAEMYRPDLIELKLILEADQQNHLVRDNQVLPQLNTTASYRWDGLEATTLAGTRVRSRAGQFTGWQLGVNFSVPLFLRAERANLREINLIIARDRANIKQQMHAITHTLAQSVHNLDQQYAQYEAFQELREASSVNLKRQFYFFRGGGLPTEPVIFLNVLQAITDWGDSITSEAASLTQYNAELANLDRQLGIILESHGVRFFEERFQSIGPLGRLQDCECYARKLLPSENVPRYADNLAPAEDSFELDSALEELEGKKEEDGEYDLERAKSLSESAEELKELMKTFEADGTEPPEPNDTPEKPLGREPEQESALRPHHVPTDVRKVRYEVDRQGDAFQLDQDWVFPIRVK